MKKIIIGVSGGPDSMALLGLLNQEDKYKIIVNHVNYHFRKDSNVDERIVRNYCERNNIVLEVLNIDDKILEDYSYLKNKQSIARQIRYDFYIKNALKYKTKYLYLAHHKDDFIETAIMQEERSKKLYFYGIEKKSNYKKLKVERPLIDFYKQELISFCKKRGINFAIDSTNSEPIYERNRIRIELSKKSIEQKDEIFNYYKKINSSNEKKRKKIESLYLSWEKQNFKYEFFNELSLDLQKNLIYKFLIFNDYFIKINNNKLDGLIEFLKKGDKNKSYRLSDYLFLSINKEKNIEIKEK